MYLILRPFTFVSQLSRHVIQFSLSLHPIKQPLPVVVTPIFKIVFAFSMSKSSEHVSLVSWLRWFVFCLIPYSFLHILSLFDNLSILDAWSRLDLGFNPDGLLIWGILFKHFLRNFRNYNWLPIVDFFDGLRFLSLWFSRVLLHNGFVKFIGCQELGFVVENYGIYWSSAVVALFFDLFYEGVLCWFCCRSLHDYWLGYRFFTCFFRLFLWLHKRHRLSYSRHRKVLQYLWHYAH